MAPLPQRVVSELLGTAFLLAAVVGSGIMAQRLAGGNGALALLCNTLPTGAILTVLILIFGPLSGAHFNPAVSVAFALRGDIPWLLALIYIACQVAGGIAGTLAAHLMFELPIWQLSATVRTGGGQWLAEAVATLVSCSPSSDVSLAPRALSRMRWGSTSRPPIGSPPPRRSPIRLLPLRARCRTRSRALRLPAWPRSLSPSSRA
jgi:glycerol uptake facilitator-like aquaporin